MLEKLKSRKFLMALLSVVVGTLTMFGVNDATVQLVDSIGLIALPVIIYIVTEGKIDEKSVQMIIDASQEVLDKVEETKKEEE